MKKSFSLAPILSVWFGTNISGPGKSLEESLAACSELEEHLLVGQAPKVGVREEIGRECPESLGRQLPWLERVPRPPTSDYDLAAERANGYPWLRQQISDHGPRHGVVPMSEES